MSLSFLLDEHLRGPLWQAAVRYNLRGSELLDVVRVGDPADLPLSTTDQDLLLWAERESRILVTEDRHTMSSHLRSHLLEGHHSPGILIIRANQPMRLIIDSLVLISEVGDPHEFADVITYIP